MKKSFQELMRSTVNQAESILDNAEALHKILLLIDGKLGALNDVAAEGSRRTQDRSN